MQVTSIFIEGDKVKSNVEVRHKWNYWWLEFLIQLIIIKDEYLFTYGIAPFFL